MSNWSPFLSDEMDAWISGSSWPDQQPHSLPSYSALQSSQSSTSSLAPFLPPLFNSLTSFHSSLGSPTPNLGFHTAFDQAPASASASASSSSSSTAFGLSPFAAPTLSTSSQPAGRRSDGPSLPPSQHPSTGPLHPTQPTDHFPTTTTTTTSSTTTSTTSSRQNSTQQQTHLSHPSANPASRLRHTLTAPLHESSINEPRQDRLRETNNDDFLEALATGDFSSPSLPPYSPQSPPQHRPRYDSRLNQSSYHQRPGFSARFGPAHRVPGPDSPLFKTEDQGDGDHDEDDKITIDSLLAEMPATRKRTRAVASPDERDGPSAPKRARTAVAHRAATPGRSRNTPRPAATRNYTPVEAAVTIESDDNDIDSLFDGDGEQGGVELYDLTKSEDAVPQHLFQPVKDSSIKLSTFECVICMDAATNLTVTCCGHMFCAQCLHQAMHTELTKKVCPMCRQRLDKSTSKSRPPAKAFFHLELKLRPSKKSGKQPARR